MIGKCPICGGEMSSETCEIRVFTRTWRKKLTKTCAECGRQMTISYRGKRKPGNAMKAAVAVVKLSDAPTVNQLARRFRREFGIGKRKKEGTP